MAKSSFSASQKKALLWVVAILLGIRFVLVPLMDYQNQLKENISLESRQLERALALLNNEQQGVSAEQANADLKELESRLPLHESVNQFRLSMQQQLEQLAKKQQANIQVFDWLTHSTAQDGYLQTHQGQIEIEGAITDIARFQLDALSQWYSVQWIEFSIRPMRGTSQRGELRVPNVRATILFEVSGIKPGEKVNSGE
ncbi:MAG: hypothetical protein ACQEVQ_10570 [Pseudomonadota bacterium]